MYYQNNILRVRVKINLNKSIQKPKHLKIYYYEIVCLIRNDVYQWYTKLI